MFKQAFRRFLPPAAVLCLLSCSAAFGQTEPPTTGQPLALRELATASDVDSVAVFLTELDGTIRLSRESEASLRQTFNRSSWVFFNQAGTTTGGTTGGTTPAAGDPTGVLILASNNVPLLFAPALRAPDGAYILHNANVTRGGNSVAVINGKISRGITTATGGTPGINQGRADLFLTTVSLAGTVSTAYVSIPLAFSQLPSGTTPTTPTTPTEPTTPTTPTTPTEPTTPTTPTTPEPTPTPTPDDTPDGTPDDTPDGTDSNP